MICCLLLCCAADLLICCLLLFCREYSRALALVASRAPRPEWTTFFCHCANEAAEAESGFHEVGTGKTKCVVFVGAAHAAPAATWWSLLCLLRL